MAYLLPAGEDGCSDLVNPLVGDSPDHVCMAELAAHRELDYKIRVLGVTLHLEPIAVVRDPEHQARPAPWPRRHRVPHDAQIEFAWLLAPGLLDCFHEPVGW